MTSLEAVPGPWPRDNNQLSLVIIDECTYIMTLTHMEGADMGADMPEALLEKLLRPVRRVSGRTSTAKSWVISTTRPGQLCLLLTSCRLWTLLLDELSTLDLITYSRVVDTGILYGEGEARVS